MRPGSVAVATTRRTFAAQEASIVAEITPLATHQPLRGNVPSDVRRLLVHVRIRGSSASSAIFETSATPSEAPLSLVLKSVIRKFASAMPAQPRKNIFAFVLLQA